MGNLLSSLHWRTASSLFSLPRFRSLFHSSRTLASKPPAATITEPCAADPEAKHILIVGGAYGGLSALITLQRILSGAPHQPGPYNLPSVTGLPRTPPRITLLDERDGIYHTVGTPLVHTSPDIATTAPRAWKKYADIPYLKDVTVVHGRVENVDPERKEVVYTMASSGSEKPMTMSYDYLVCATGLKRAWPVQPRATTKEDFLKDVKSLVGELVDGTERIVVVGGGAVGTEFAAELKLTQPEKHITLVHSQSTILSTEPLPQEFKAKALELLQETGVEVLLSTRVVEETAGEIRLSTGDTIKASSVIWCVGRQHPATTFLPPLALEPSTGLVRISATFNFPAEVPNHASHFAVGDITKWSGIKRVGSALLMGSFAATNVILSIVAAENEQEPELAQFPEVVPMLVLALGKKAVGYHPAYPMSWGEEPLQQSFGDNLGLSICWKCLGIEVEGESTSMLAEK